MIKKMIIFFKLILKEKEKKKEKPYLFQVKLSISLNHSFDFRKKLVQTRRLFIF